MKTLRGLNWLVIALLMGIGMNAARAQDDKPAPPDDDAPAMDAPPVADAPDADAPNVDAPDADAPKKNAPMADAPDGDAEPATDAPVVEAPMADAPDNPQSSKLLVVSPDDLAPLKALTAATRAISLGVGRAVLVGDDAATRGLLQWVRGGGTVFLHTDAAQLFGYRSIVPRRATDRIAGQFWGRARAALPFGAHRLLLGALANRGAVSAVRTVYYQLEAGDCLVGDHPAAVPLLRVTDLAASSRQPVYAAAIAPFGRGWAIFTPGFVDPRRGDGAVFVRNLMAWAGVSPDEAGDARQAGDAQAPAVPTFVSLPVAAIARAADAAQRDDFDAAAASQMFLQAIKASQTILQPDVQAPDAQVPDAQAPGTQNAGLPLTQPELAATLGVLSDAGDANAAVDKSSARAVVYLLAARVAWQRGALREANTWLARASAEAPDAAEVALWQGLIAAQASEDHTLASPVRAQFLAQAISAWAQCLKLAPLIRVVAMPQKVRPNSAPIATAATDEAVDEVGGVSRTLVAAWMRSASVAAKLFAFEPPLVTLVGNGESGIVIRHFPDDPSLRLAIPVAQRLAAASALLGARGDEEEALFFPTPEYYTAYRRAAGLAGQNTPAPGSLFGDVVDGRMLLLSQSTQLLVIPGPPKQAPRAMALGAALPQIMGRLHAGVLVQQIAGGAAGAQNGARVPAWLQMGLAAYAGQGIEGGLAASPNLAANGVLSPDDFRAIAGGAAPNALADYQAMRLTAYFYARFGAGDVIETLQRLGAGENLDSALNATTGLTENQFFAAWLKAEAGA